MSATEIDRMRVQLDRLLNVRRSQIGSRASATQRRIDALYREIQAAEAEATR